MESLLHTAQQQADAAQQVSLAAIADKDTALAQARNCQADSERAAREAEFATESAIAADARSSESKKLILQAESQAAGQLAGAFGLRDAAVMETLEAVSAKDYAESAMTAQLIAFAAKEAMYVADNAKLAAAAEAANRRHVADSAKAASAAESVSLMHATESAKLAAAAEAAISKHVTELAKVSAAAESANLRHAAESAKVAAAAESANLRHAAETVKLAAEAEAASLKYLADTAKLAAAAESAKKMHVAENAKLAAAAEAADLRRVTGNAKLAETAVKPANFRTADIAQQGIATGVPTSLEAARDQDRLGASSTHPAPTSPGAAAALGGAAAQFPLHTTTLDQTLADVGKPDLYRALKNAENAGSHLEWGLQSEVLGGNNAGSCLATDLHSQAADLALPSIDHQMETLRQVTKQQLPIEMCENRAACTEASQPAAVQSTFTSAGTQILDPEVMPHRQVLGAHLMGSTAAVTPLITALSASAEVPPVPALSQIEASLPRLSPDCGLTSATHVMTASDAMHAATAAAAAAYSDAAANLQAGDASQQQALAPKVFGGTSRGQKVRAPIQAFLL